MHFGQTLDQRPFSHPLNPAGLLCSMLRLLSQVCVGSANLRRAGDTNQSAATSALWCAIAKGDLFDRPLYVGLASLRAVPCPGHT